MALIVIYLLAELVEPLPISTFSLARSYRPSWTSLKIPWLRVRGCLLVVHIWRDESRVTRIDQVMMHTIKAQNIASWWTSHWTSLTYMCLLLHLSAKTNEVIIYNLLGWDISTECLGSLQVNVCSQLNASMRQCARTKQFLSQFTMQLDCGRCNEAVIRQKRYHQNIPARICDKKTAREYGDIFHLYPNSLALRYYLVIFRLPRCLG